MVIRIICYWLIHCSIHMYSCTAYIAISSTLYSLIYTGWNASTPAGRDNRKAWVSSSIRARVYRVTGRSVSIEISLTCDVNVLLSPRMLFHSRVVFLRFDAAFDYLIRWERRPRPAEFSSNFPRGTNPQALDLLARMLTINPDSRITADQALRHPYLQHFQSQVCVYVHACMYMFIWICM